jgi:ribosome biogenesis GTPase
LADPGGLHRGLVVASFGRHVSVETPDGKLVTCHPRGKRSAAVVGDRVFWLASADEGTIESIDERRNMFFRQDALRAKSFAANLDLLLILVAARPGFSETQLAHALIAAEAQHIPAAIALNKSDLGEEYESSWARLEPYRRMGYTVIRMSLKRDPETALASLRSQLNGRATLVIGPSGSGKSSMINRLVPGAAVSTDVLTRSMNAGRHTTTRTTWHWIDRTAGSALIDSPGFQAFGLHHLEPTQLAQNMPDFRPHLGQCRFQNCSHLREPGCQVLKAVSGGGARDTITPARHAIYASLFAQLSQPPRY